MKMRKNVPLHGKKSSARDGGWIDFGGSSISISSHSVSRPSSSDTVRGVRKQTQRNAKFKKSPGKTASAKRKPTRKKKSPAVRGKARTKAPADKRKVNRTVKRKGGKKR